MSSKPRILVSSAAGNTGLPVVLKLREKGYPVRALVRRIDGRSEMLRNAGAEVMQGDAYSVSDMRKAVFGMQRAYHCAPTAPNGLHYGAVFAAVAQEVGLEHIVMLGQWLSQPKHPSLFTRETWLNEMTLRALPDTSLTVVNPGWFAQNYFMVFGVAAQLGILPMPLGEGEEKKNAPPSNKAIAAVVAACLMQPEDHAGQRYRPTGPELLSPNEIAVAMGKAIGRRVKYKAISEQMFAKALIANPPSNFSYQAVTQLALYAEEYRRGTFAVNAPTDVVQRVGALETESFEDTAKHAAALIPETSRGLSNRSLAIWSMIKMGLTRAPDMEKIVATRDLPQLQSPRFSIENPEWNMAHAAKPLSVATA